MWVCLVLSRIFGRRRRGMGLAGEGHRTWRPPFKVGEERSGGYELEAHVAPSGPLTKWHMSCQSVGTHGHSTSIYKHSYRQRASCSSILITLTACDRRSLCSYSVQSAVFLSALAPSLDPPGRSASFALTTCHPASAAPRRRLRRDAEA